LGELRRGARIGNLVELRVSKDFTHIIFMSKTREVLQDHFEELQERYQLLLPKFDHSLITTCSCARWENPDIVPMYTIEVFTK
jgi:hypothetical protein